MLRVYIATIIQYKTTSARLLLLVISASDILMRTIKCSLLFGVFVHAAVQAVTNKHSLVRRRLYDCDLGLHCMVVGKCIRHFVVRTSSNRSIASGAWPTVSSENASLCHVNPLIFSKLRTLHFVLYFDFEKCS